MDTVELSSKKMKCSRLFFTSSSLSSESIYFNSLLLIPIPILYWLHPTHLSSVGSLHDLNCTLCSLVKFSFLSCVSVCCKKWRQDALGEEAAAELDQQALDE